MTVRSALSWMVAPAIGAYLGVISLQGITSFGEHVLPEIETFVSPVIAFEKVSDVSRGEEQVCWTMRMHKLRWADSPRYEFYIEPEQGPPIPVAAYLADDSGKKLADQDLVSHPPGERWTRHYCFDIAGRIPDVQRMRISGHAEHRRHPFWPTITPVPSFVVCQTGRAQDGRCAAG